MQATKAKATAALVLRLAVNPSTALHRLRELYPVSSRIVLDFHPATGLLVYYAAGSCWEKSLPMALRYAAFWIIRVAPDGTFMVEKNRNPDSVEIVIPNAIVEALRGAPLKTRWQRLLEEGGLELV